MFHKLTNTVLQAGSSAYSYCVQGSKKVASVLSGINNTVYADNFKKGYRQQLTELPEALLAIKKYPNTRTALSQTFWSGLPILLMGVGYYSSVRPLMLAAIGEGYTVSAADTAFAAWASTFVPSYQFDEAANSVSVATALAEIVPPKDSFVSDESRIEKIKSQASLVIYDAVDSTELWGWSHAPIVGIPVKWLISPWATGRMLTQSRFDMTNDSLFKMLSDNNAYFLGKGYAIFTTVYVLGKLVHFTAETAFQSMTGIKIPWNFWPSSTFTELVLTKYMMSWAKLTTIVNNEPLPGGEYAIDFTKPTRRLTDLKIQLVVEALQSHLTEKAKQQKTVAEASKKSEADKKLGVPALVDGKAAVPKALDTKVMVHHADAGTADDSKADIKTAVDAKAAEAKVLNQKALTTEHPDSSLVPSNPANSSASIVMVVQTKNDYLAMGSVPLESEVSLADLDVKELYTSFKSSLRWIIEKVFGKEFTHLETAVRTRAIQTALLLNEKFLITAINGAKKLYAHEYSVRLTSDVLQYVPSIMFPSKGSLDLVTKVLYESAIKSAFPEVEKLVRHALLSDEELRVVKEQQARDVKDCMQKIIDAAIRSAEKKEAESKRKLAVELKAKDIVATALADALSELVVDKVVSEAKAQADEDLNAARLIKGYAAFEVRRPDAKAEPAVYHVDYIPNATEPDESSSWEEIESRAARLEAATDEGGASASWEQDSVSKKPAEDFYAMRQVVTPISMFQPASAAKAPASPPPAPQSQPKTGPAPH